MFMFFQINLKSLDIQEQLNTMQNTPSPPSHSEEDYDIEKLIGKIKSLKNRLLDLSHRSNATVNLTGK